MNRRKHHLKCFDRTDETQVTIVKHILKTVCTDVTNILVNFLAAELMMSAESPSSITNEVSSPLDTLLTPAILAELAAVLARLWMQSYSMCLFPVGQGEDPGKAARGN